MARPSAKQLTERELEVMHAFWEQPEMTAQEARDQLAEKGIDRAYVTVANLARILLEKGYLIAVNENRPFRYRPARSFEEFSRSFVGDLVERVFLGSREMLLVQLLGRKKLSRSEREMLRQILEEDES